MAYTSSKLACLALLALMAAALVAPCVAQNSPQDFMDLHNAARAVVGVGPVSWDDKVAVYAQSYTAQRQSDCALMHSSNSPYGENIIAGPAGSNTSAAVAVGMWVDKKKNYHHETNSCSLPDGCLHHDTNC